MANADEQSIEDLLSITDDKGKSVVRIGLLVTLNFQGASTTDKRLGVLRCVDDYWSMCGDKLTWAVNSKKWVKSTSAAASRIRERLMSTPEDSSWEFYSHGGVQVDEASDYRMEGFGQYDWKEASGKVSYISASFPMTWFAERTEKLPDLVERWARYIDPLHGYAGLGIGTAHMSTTATKHEPTVFGLAARFPGLEVDYPVIHSLDGASGIKGVNWLTVLADAWLEKLGGVDALRAQLDDRFLIRQYKSGIVIQAGAKPQLGDRNRDRFPELYVKLNAALRSIRVKDVYPFQHGGPNRFTHETSNAWIARFDRHSGS